MAVSWQSLDPAGLEAPFSENLGHDDAPYASFEPAGESPFAEAASGASSEGAWSEALPEFEGEGFPSGIVLQPGQGATGPGQEHWDPNGVGLPLLATPPSTHAVRLSTAFTVGELVRSGGRASSVARISPALVRVLQAIRDHAGKPIRITSGYRSFARNGAVYAARNQTATKSRHSSGQAADITITGMSGVAIAKLALDAAGTDLAIGIGRADIHVDVRGTFTVWSYLKGAAGAAGIAEVRAHRERLLHAMAPIPTPPRPTVPSPLPPRPTPAGPIGDRLVIERHPLLRGHRGTPPDLVLRWSRVTGPGPVDVVVHFHGYSGKREGMRIDRDKEPASGLDLSGRMRPTLALLPRGNYFGGQSGSGYNFPALVRPGALDELVRDGLARLTQATGHQVSRGRLILTGHSGGGAPVTAIVLPADPDEVHVFDGLYGSGSNITRWAKQRIAREQASPSAIPPAMRILYRPGTGTQANSEAIARALRPDLRAGSALARSFRVDGTRVAHDAIPGRFGPALLADAGADLSEARTFNETSELEGPLSESYETPPSEAVSEHLEWFDPAGEEFGAQWTTGESYLESSGEYPVAESSFELPSTEGPYAEMPTGESTYEGPYSESTYEGPYSESTYGEAEVQEQPYGEATLGEQLLAEAGSSEAAVSMEWGEAGAIAEWQEAGEGPLGEWQESGEGPLGEELDIPGEDLEAGPWSGAEASTETALDAWGEGPSEAEWNSLMGDTFATEAGDRPVLEALLESEVGAGTGLADRLKSVAAFVLGGTLRRGDSGAGVAALQRALGALGIDVAVDGSFGAHTERAVRAFQARRSITEDGVVGPLTKAAIAAALSSGAPSDPVPGPPSPTPARPSTGADRAAGIVRQSPASTPCAGDWQPGARALAAQWTRLTGRKAGGYVCRPIRGSQQPSVHGDGRAIDAYANANDPAQRAQAEIYAAWLIANAVELQCAYIIWNGRQWSWPRRAEGWRPYHGVSTHTDHLHIEVSWEGARQPSGLFSGGVPGLGSGTPTPPGPVPPAAVPPGPVPPAGQRLAPRVFVATYGPAARASQATSGVPALVTLGQAALESGWGQKAPRFNFFGIKAKTSDPEDRRQLLVTREVYRDGNRKLPNIISIKQRPDGKFDYMVRAWFRAYPDVKAAFDDHARVLRLPRYANAFTVANEPYAFATEVARGGYATDPSYASVLHGVMRTIEGAGGP